MRKTLLIARREYLAFVRTVGFWLSLFTFPLIIGCSIMVPLLLHGTEPTRTVAVLDLTGDHIEGDIRGFISAKSPKPGEDGGMRPAPLPEGLSPSMSVAEAEKAIPDILTRKAVSAVVVAWDDGKTLHFHIWSQPGHREDVEKDILWDLHGLQYYKLAGMHGVDHGLAHDMHESRADIVSLTPQSAGDARQNDIVQGFKENGPRFVGIAVSYLTWISIFSSSMILLGSVIEEKASKVIEVLLASASTSSILLGKVLGVAGVMLTVASIWILTAVGLSYYGVSAMPAGMSQALGAALSGMFSPVHILLLLSYLVGGYLMFGIFFAAVGAFCETQKDAQAIIGPTTILLMIPMFTMQAAFRSVDLPMLQYLSWFPLFTPFLMPLRLSQPLPWYEIAGTLVGMLIVAVIMINIGRRAFRHGALTGEKLSWGALLGLGRRDT